MKDPEVKNLPIDEFEELAKSQVTLFPDLLNFGDEEEIIQQFYDYYGRKRKSKH